MEAIYTPGPWKVAADPDNNVIGREQLLSIWAGPDMGPGRPGLVQIAKITYGGKIMSENNANARLIAAAPELAEACHYIDYSISDSIGEYEDEEVLTIYIAGVFVKQLRAALKKAGV